MIIQINKILMKGFINICGGKSTKSVAWLQRGDCSSSSEDLLRNKMEREKHALTFENIKWQQIGSVSGCYFTLTDTYKQKNLTPHNLSVNKGTVYWIMEKNGSYFKKQDLYLFIWHQWDPWFLVIYIKSYFIIKCMYFLVHNHWRSLWRLTFSFCS